MRASSLTNLGVGVDYNISSDYDKVLVVAGLASEIEELAPHANEIANLVANLPDVLTVQEASELVNNLTVKVTTLPAGSTATSDLVGTEIRLGIPAGTQGVQGLQGPKGDKGDKGDIGLTGSQGPIGLTGPQGPRGLRGNDGVDGAGVEITSILNNPNKSLTINFSDGTQHTTDPLKGQDGTSITVTNVVNNPNGTMQINFSDGTSHTTANLTGPRGFKGDTGDHVHHISYQRSKDALGNEVGPVTPSQRGYTDTYAMWSSQEELPETYIGEFTVYNGLNALTAEEQYKFDSIEFGATADQEAFEVVYDSSVSGLVAYNVQDAIDSLNATTVKLAEKGQPDGVASLDSNGLVLASQLPSYVDDVLEYANLSAFPAVGESGKIYIALDTNKAYRWSGSTYVYITSGAVDSVAGKTGVVTLVKADVGLGNVDNTSDANKPISTTTQNALNLKANAANAALTGVPTAPTAAVGTSTTQVATTAYVNAEIANDTYSKTQLDAGQLNTIYYTKANLDGGQLDNRYYTETELNNGALDTRYYTEAEIDTKLAAQNDASEIVVVPTGNLVSTNVQAALVELQGDIDNRYTKSETTTLLAGKVDKTVFDAANLNRADKYLANQNIVNMLYTNGDLTKIRYRVDSDTDYETLSYVNGNLTTIRHYINAVLKGTTTLSYGAGNLVSAVFIAA